MFDFMEDGIKQEIIIKLIYNRWGRCYPKKVFDFEKIFENLKSIQTLPFNADCFSLRGELVTLKNGNEYWIREFM